MHVCVNFLPFSLSDALDVPGKILFQESETLSPGCELAKFKTNADPALKKSRLQECQ